MTKKDFEIIAKVIESNVLRSSKTEESRLQALAAELAEKFKIINPRFDTQRFIAACGLHS